jgi:long-chain acyl-CoA synthetase
MNYKTEETLGELCLSAVQKYNDKPALAMLCEDKICRSFTYTQMGDRVRQIGFLLNETGVEKGGKVLLLSENCPEWALFYFGISCAGAVSVPLLTGFSAEQIYNIALHANVRAICLSRSMREKIAIFNDLENSALSQIPLIYIDTITGSEITVSLNGNEKQIQLSEKDYELPKCKADDLATIIYTSGTQGNCKGVLLSNKNLIFCAYSTLTYVKLSPRDRLLSVLPLAHSYECTLGLIVPVFSGANITYFDRPPSPSALTSAVKVLRPTMIVAVPLLIEKIYRNAIAPKLQKNILYKFPVTRPLAVKIAGKKLIYSLGGCIRFFGIGGAPLSEEVEKFLHSAGFPYSTGYGLTEAAPLVAGNKPNCFPFRSAGKAPSGVSVRIAKCDIETDQGVGEIQVKGPNVMIGYYNDEKRTAEAFTPDGWLKTGDLGKLDKNGRLYFMGRQKALILGPSGENIYPEEIENLLGSSDLVEDALVYSGEKGELVALVLLTSAAKTAAGAVENALEELRLWVNKKLAVFSRLNRIEIRENPFEKTPTMKIKRYLYV